jgi:hypothetical protein
LVILHRRRHIVYFLKYFLILGVRQKFSVVF